MKETEAQAKANELPAKSLNNELIRYNGGQKCNGAYPHRLLGDKADRAILNVPSTGGNTHTANRSGKRSNA